MRAGLCAVPGGIGLLQVGRGEESPRPRDRHRGSKHCFELAHKMCALDFPAKQECVAGKCCERASMTRAARERARNRMVHHSVSPKRGIPGSQNSVTRSILHFSSLAPVARAEHWSEQSAQGSRCLQRPALRGNGFGHFCRKKSAPLAGARCTGMYKCRGRQDAGSD